MLGEWSKKILISFLKLAVGCWFSMFADFVPEGESSTTLSDWVKVEGAEPGENPITPDSKLVKEADGKEVELRLSGTKPGVEVTLTFDIRDAKTQ